MLPCLHDYIYYCLHQVTSNKGRLQMSKPSHIAYVVNKSDDDGKDFWRPVGAVWPHKNGGGYTVQLIAGISVSGRFVIRPAKADNNGGQQ